MCMPSTYTVQAGAVPIRMHAAPHPLTSNATSSTHTKIKSSSSNGNFWLQVKLSFDTRLGSQFVHPCWLHCPSRLTRYAGHSSETPLLGVGNSVEYIRKAAGINEHNPPTHNATLTLCCGRANTHKSPVPRSPLVQYIKPSSKVTRTGHVSGHHQ